jgi:hypothetical protein
MENKNRKAALQAAEQKLTITTGAKTVSMAFRRQAGRSRYFPERLLPYSVLCYLLMRNRQAGTGFS